MFTVSLQQMVGRINSVVSVFVESSKSLVNRCGGEFGECGGSRVVLMGRFRYGGFQRPRWCNARSSGDCAKVEVKIIIYIFLFHKKDVSDIV